jgi:CubicO group peptidase (beta-lactamase class C family)
MENSHKGFQRFKTKFAAFILLGSLTTPLFAQAQSNRPEKPDFSKVCKLIQEQLVTTSIPSISVAVVRRGEIIWEEGFGFADRESHIPATEHTMYYLASVSKTITATALMVLSERKRIDLDRPS